MENPPKPRNPPNRLGDPDSPVATPVLPPPPFALRVPRMSPDPRLLLLSAASARLRKPGGRPRRSPLPAPATSVPSYAAGITPPLTPINTGAAPRAQATVAPARLLDVDGAARYLGVSKWTVKDLIDAGHLARVRLPGARDRDLRRLLVDVRDLDALINANKEGGA